MNTFSDIRRVPFAFHPERGAEAVDRMGLDAGPLADLIGGAAGCSPFLAGLIQKEHEWLAAAIEAPDQALADLFSDLSAHEAKTLGAALRIAKRRVALLTALADLGGVWSLETVTGYLTQFADLSVTLALKSTIGAEIARGKLPGMGPEDADTAGGMVALAMGKMGAFELNYSSDIDLICLFDETRFQPDDFHDARSSFVRATRKMHAMLNDMTAEGYVFRTDLRLRPDPSVTPVCLAMEAAERYYESLGRAWERAAYIKARPCAGDLAAGTRFLKTLTPFVWRKHLDFNAIQDAHDMRLRYREHKGMGGDIKLPDHNMKLGRGGIREIEFFTQTRQVIAGGRDPELRVSGTVPALGVLAQKGWIDPSTAQTLTDHYRAHREVEHRLQMINDAQTHSLPGSEDGFDRLAAFMGTESATLKSDVMTRLNEVHALTEGFFAPDAARPEQGHDFDTEVIARWQSYPALRSARGVEIFERLKPDFLERLSHAAKPADALLAFDGFLAGLPAGVQLFALFEANPHLIDLLVDIVSTAPALARHLSRNSGVFDAVIGGGFFDDWQGTDALCQDLEKILSRDSDYERKLDATRRWAKEWHFAIGVHHLRGLIDASAAAGRYADLASATLSALWPHVVEQFATKHGPMPGRGAAIVGMGSLGARRLNARSDLDLIMIYDAGGVETSEGRRPLAARVYYARLTQAMVTAMTAPMAEGRLYEVDMRLRPSGTSGPVATSLDSFITYQENDAWLWEHLALTRARVIAGDAGVADDVETFRQRIVAQPREADFIRAQVAEMRTRIAAAKPGGPWDAKIGPGRMQDIELIAQAGLLGAGCSDRTIHEGLQQLVVLGWCSDAERQVLDRAYSLFFDLQVASKLINETELDAERLDTQIGEGGLRFLRATCKAQDTEELEQNVGQTAMDAALVIDAILERTS